MNKQWIRLAGGVATVALLAVGCSMSPSMTHAMPGSMAGTATSATKAADLRTGLNALLGEHVYLASAATNAALGGRQAEFEAAAAALDANSVDIAKAIGSVYGADAEKAFLPLWRRHIGFFVDYTVGVATKDKSKQGKAVNDLVGYTEDFGAFRGPVGQGSRRAVPRAPSAFRGALARQRNSFRTSWTSSGVREISIRRFSARPSGVSLLATGRKAP